MDDWAFAPPPRDPMSSAPHAGADTSRGTRAISSALHGAIRDDARTSAEFLALERR